MLFRPSQGADSLREAQTWGCGLGQSLQGLRHVGRDPCPLSYPLPIQGSHAFTCGLPVPSQSGSWSMEVEVLP